MPDLLRVALYLRHTTDRQEDSCARQLSIIVSYLRARSHYRFHGASHPAFRGEPWADEKRLDKLLKAAQRGELAIYVDRGIEGGTDERPDFQRLLRDCQEGRYDLILVDQGSRLSRHQPVKFFALVAHPLMESGVAVESVQRGRVLDWNDVGDFLIQSVDQFRDHEESRSTAWRVLSDAVVLASRAELYQGRVAYGYALGKRPDGRPTYVRGDPREVEVIQFVFDAYGNLGWSLRDIAAELVARGVVTPRGRKDWRQSTLVRWLRDPVYIGTYRWNVTSYAKFYRKRQSGIEAVKVAKRRAQRNKRQDWVLIPNNHAELVTPELYAHCQELLTENKKHTSPGRARRDFVLAGLLVCDRCGCRMTGAVPRRAGTDKVYPATYRCVSGYDAGKCGLNTVHEAEVLQAILAAIQGYASPANLDRLRQLARESLAAVCKPANLDPLRAERAELERHIARGRRNLALLEDEADVGAVAAQIAEWRTRAAEIEQLLGEAERPAALAALDDAISETEKLVWELAELAREADPRRLRALLVRLVKRVRVRVRKRLIGKNRHAYDLLPGVIELNPGSALSERAGGLLSLSTADPCTEQAASSWGVRFAC